MRHNLPSHSLIWNGEWEQLRSGWGRNVMAPPYNHTISSRTLCLYTHIPQLRLSSGSHQYSSSLLFATWYPTVHFSGIHLPSPLSLHTPFTQPSTSRSQRYPCSPQFSTSSGSQIRSYRCSSCGHVIEMMYIRIYRSCSSGFHHKPNSPHRIQLRRNMPWNSLDQRMRHRTSPHVCRKPADVLYRRISRSRRLDLPNSHGPEYIPATAVCRYIFHSRRLVLPNNHGLVRIHAEVVCRYIFHSRRHDFPNSQGPGCIPVPESLCNSRSGMSRLCHKPYSPRTAHLRRSIGTTLPGRCSCHCN